MPFHAPGAFQSHIHHIIPNLARIIAAATMGQCHNAPMAAIDLVDRDEDAKSQDSGPRQEIDKENNKEDNKEDDAA